MNKKNDRFRNISLLYLCERDIYLTRTSRGRFHAVQAIEKRCQVLWSGPGWDNWDLEKSLDENIKRLYKGKKPDIVFCYKPFTVKGFSDTSIPTCVSYMEMGTLNHSRSYTIKEITENRVDLVICFHHNEMIYPEFKGLPCMMVNIPHCIDETIFKDYRLPKEIDLLLVGSYHPRKYPLRTRLEKMILKMRVDPKFSGFKMGVWDQPGKRIPNAYNNKQLIEYAKELNRTKICLSCSGRHHTRYAKYAEIPACRSLMMADLPDEDHDFFRQFIAVIDMNESDREIEKKILYFLHNNEERDRMTDIGYQLTQSQYTWDHYAERFLNVVEKYLVKYDGKKLPFWSTS